MTINKAYTRGFRLSLRSPKMIFTVYITYFIFAAALALAFWSNLNKSIGSSMIFDSMLQQFDYTAISDLLANEGGRIMAQVSQFKWFLLLYWLLSVYLVGGIILTLNRETFTFNSFFGGAGHNFPRFARLGIIMLILHLLIAVMIYAGLGGIINYLMDGFKSEKQLVYWILGGISLHLLFMILLFMISDYSKFELLLNDTQNTLKSLWRATKFVFSHIFTTYGLYLLLILVPIASFYIFNKINSDIEMTSTVGILLMFAVQQAFVFVRTWFRIWILGSQFELYGDFFIKQEKIASEKARIQEWEDQVNVMSDDVNQEVEESAEAKEEDTEKPANTESTENENMQTDVDENPEDTEKKEDNDNKKE